MITRTASVLLTLACTAGLLTAVAAPSAVGTPIAAAVARCEGRVPTIVGTGKRVKGTPGDDVIVVLGKRAFVSAGDGDDRICVRGGGAFQTVVGGPGDDQVRVETRAFVFADLRAGTDTYRGGPGTDLVISGWPGARNSDRILLGRGTDILTLAEASDHRRAVLHGGSGDDTLRVMRRAGAIQVDAGTGRTALDGRAYARWSSFDSHEISSGGRQAFLGSAGDDEVSFNGRGAIEALTRDGDDTVALRVDPGYETLASEAPRELLRVGMALDTGEGRDRLEVYTSATSVVGDLTFGRLSFEDEMVSGATGILEFAGVEDLAVSAPTDGFGIANSVPQSRVELIGNDTDNELSASACHVVLRGAGGNDTLRVGRDDNDILAFFAGGLDRGCRRTSEVYGELGDDTLMSRVTVPDTRDLELGESVKEVELAVKDLLDGGEGVDSAKGGAGQDTCFAETRLGCED